MVMLNDIKRMAEDSFRQHTITKISETIFLCKKPGTGHYHFYVAWLPGRLVVSGDIGDAIYVFHDAASLDMAVGWVTRANFGYAVSKNPLAREVFSFEGSLRSLIEDGDEEVIRRIQEETRSHKTGEELFKHASGVLEICEETIYRLSGYDSECFVTSHEPNSYWCFFALKRWAELMAGEPA